MRKSLLNKARLMETVHVSESATLIESVLCAHVKLLNTRGENIYLNTAVLTFIHRASYI
jgi:hypothetical protein